MAMQTHRIIDTHCHLDAAEFDVDRDQVITRTLNAGVNAIIVPAIAQENFAKVLHLDREHSCCGAALGLHPLFIHAHRPAHLAQLRAAIEERRPVAIGEIGLDFFVPDLDTATQEFYLVEQLKIARDFDLPVLLHSRRANDQVMKQLRRFGIHRGIAHAFSGSRQQADAFIGMGLKLGFGGAMTFTRATNLRRLATELPLDAIVLETDAPDISPAWLHPQRNSPEQLPRIAAILAELRNIPMETVICTTTNNARAALGPELEAMLHREST